MFEQGVVHTKILMEEFLKQAPRKERNTLKTWVEIVGWDHRQTVLANFRECEEFSSNGVNIENICVLVQQVVQQSLTTDFLRVYGRKVRDEDVFNEWRLIFPQTLKGLWEILHSYHVYEAFYEDLLDVDGLAVVLGCKTPGYLQACVLEISPKTRGDLYDTVHQVLSYHAICEEELFFGFNRVSPKRVMKFIEYVRNEGVEGAVIQSRAWRIEFELACQKVISAMNMATNGISTICHDELVLMGFYSRFCRVQELPEYLCTVRWYVDVWSAETLKKALRAAPILVRLGDSKYIDTSDIETFFRIPSTDCKVLREHFKYANMKSLAHRARFVRLLPIVQDVMLGKMDKFHEIAKWAGKHPGVAEKWELEEDKTVKNFHKLFL